MKYFQHFFMAIVELCLILGLVNQAAATTYYVDLNGSDTDGLSWATAFRTVQAALNTAGTGDVVEIGGGTYAGSLTSKSAGVVIQGSTAAGHNDPVTVLGDANENVLAVNHQTTWRRITFDGSLNTNASYYVIWIEDASSPTFDQCIIGPGQRLLNIKTGGASFTRCTIQGARVSPEGPATNIIAVNAVTDAVTFSYCLIADAGYGYINAVSAGKLDFNNCLLAGFNGSVLYLPEVAAFPEGVFWTNCLVLANGVKADAILENANPAVNVVVTHSLVQARTPYYLNSPKYINVTEVVAPLSGSPLLTHGRRKALLNIGIDDEASIDFWDQVATECDKYGFKTTLALNTAVATAADWLVLQRHVNNGHEVASHTAHHVYLAGPVGDPEGLPVLFTLRYIGSTGSDARLTIDRTVTPPVLTVTVTGDSGADVSLPLSSEGDYPTIADVKAVFDAKSESYTFTLTTLSGSSYDSGRWLSQDAAAVANADIKTADVTVSVDSDAVAADELTASKQTIEANLTDPLGGAYTCDAFVYPYEGNNVWSITAARAAGYRVARSDANGSFAMGAPGGYGVLDILCTEPSLIFGTTWTEQELREQVSAVLEWLKFTGGAISLFSHNLSGEFTFAQWQTLLAIIASDPDVEVVTLGQIMDYISANGASSDGGLTYVRSAAWPDVANYVPQSGSPLLGAGLPYATTMVDYGGTTVAAGTIPDVGLYQTAQGPSGSALVPAIYKLLLLP